MSNRSNWYQMNAEEVFEVLGSDRGGIVSSEAEARLEKYGYNELKFKKISPFFRFLMQFSSPLIYILLAAALVTGLLGYWIDTTFILGVVFANTIMGFIMEGKAEASIEALRKMMAPECTVLRDGERKTIPARELVPGDIVLLEGGDRVPADLRLFYTKDMSADEATLTGESIPARKDTECISIADLPAADQRCMAFSGTFITRGYGQGVVIGTGGHTEIGRIAEIIKETRKIATPLLRKIKDFSKVILAFILIITAITFVLAMTFEFGFVYAFMASVSLAVASIPAGLPAMLTVTLAIGVTAMAQRHVLVRKLPAIEILGSATIICSDKTGTFTKNQMTVVRVYSGGKNYRVSGTGYEPRGEFSIDGKGINPAEEERDLLETLKAGYFCNSAALTEGESGYGIEGDPTEGALMVSAAKAGIREKSPWLDIIQFEPKHQYMATLHEGKDRNIIYVKGSPEKILNMCSRQLINEEIQPIRSEEVLTEADTMAGDALRVLGMAYKIVPREKTLLSLKDLEGLVFLGLQGMIDPPREEAIEAVAKCKIAGIRVVMITGDHAMTAKAIAKKLGIYGYDGRALTGEDLSRMSDEELYDAVDEVSVYARVAPEHKFRITKQLQNKGHVVAVTGDGVNDAPALKAADIGIAMGITGTEVSKEAADMVLVDDNFASIEAAIEEGRHVFENIRKAILFLLPTNGGQASLVMGAVLLSPFMPLFAERLPLEPLHILWVNLSVAIFLSLPLVVEPREEGLLQRPPRNPKEKLIDHLFIKKVGLVSLTMVIVVFALYYHYGMPAISGQVDKLLLTQAQTAALMSIMLLHIFYLLTARSITKSVFTFNPFSNRWVLIGIVISLGAQLMITYTPTLQAIFRTAAFPAEWWIPIILSALPGLFIIEIEKFLKKRFSEGKY
ncbi:HAD-IC family P-type ATPase [Thermodesulfovibrionales bacterium]|nr:HAD-IC family P-type ATPase [Thermodesulfovibrionales bacterium]